MGVSYHLVLLPEVKIYSAVLNDISKSSSYRVKHLISSAVMYSGMSVHVSVAFMFILIIIILLYYNIILLLLYNDIIL